MSNQQNKGLNFAGWMIGCAIAVPVLGTILAGGACVACSAVATVGAASESITAVKEARRDHAAGLHASPVVACVDCMRDDEPRTEKENR